MVNPLGNSGASAGIVSATSDMNIALEKAVESEARPAHGVFPEKRLHALTGLSAIKVARQLLRFGGGNQVIPNIVHKGEAQRRLVLLRQDPAWDGKYTGGYENGNLGKNLAVAKQIACKAIGYGAGNCGELAAVVFALLTSLKSLTTSSKSKNLDEELDAAFAGVQTGLDADDEIHELTEDLYLVTADRFDHAFVVIGDPYDSLSIAVDAWANFGEPHYIGAGKFPAGDILAKWSPGDAPLLTNKEIRHHKALGEEVLKRDKYKAQDVKTSTFQMVMDKDQKTLYRQDDTHFQTNLQREKRIGAMYSNDDFLSSLLEDPADLSDESDSDSDDEIAPTQDRVTRF